MFNFVVIDYPNRAKSAGNELCSRFNQFGEDLSRFEACVLQFQASFPSIINATKHTFGDFRVCVGCGMCARLYVSNVVAVAVVIVVVVVLAVVAVVLMSVVAW